MTAPIDRIENVRAQVADVERQMEACRVAGVQFSPRMTWQLLSACKSLLGPTLEAERAEARAAGAKEARRRIAAYVRKADYLNPAIADHDSVTVDSLIDLLNELAARIARQEGER